MDRKLNFSFAFALRALAAWAAAALLLLFAAALIAKKAALDARVIAYMSAALSFIAAAAAGAWGVRGWQGARLVCGLLCGGCVTIVLLMLGFIIAGSDMPSDGVMSVASFTFAGCLLGSVIGGRGHRRKKSAVSVGRR